MPIFSSLKTDAIGYRLFNAIGYHVFNDISDKIKLYIVIYLIKYASMQIQFVIHEKKHFS